MCRFANAIKTISIANRFELIANALPLKFDLRLKLDVQQCRFNDKPYCIWLNPTSLAYSVKCRLFIQFKAMLRCSLAMLHNTVSVFRMKIHFCEFISKSAEIWSNECCFANSNSVASFHLQNFLVNRYVLISNVQ